MNTPGHAVVNLLILGDRARPNLFAPVALGAIVPDVPMFLFYLHEKMMLATPEPVIWSQSYNKVGWQAFFDVFNSIPLLALAGLTAYALKSPRVVAFCASMALHSVCDLFLHHNDAHRHFYPFSHWRFASPVSYWDPAHYGSIVSSIEIVVVIIGAMWLFKSYPAKSARGFLALILGSYALYIGYAVLVWM